MIDQIICGDCLEVLPTVPDKSVDMVLADLPYGVIASSWDVLIDVNEVTQEFNRIIKDQRVIALTATQPMATDLINANRSRFKYEWVWVKSRASLFVHAKNRPMGRHEFIVIFSNGSMNHKTISSNRMIYNPQGVKEVSIRKTRNAPRFGITYGKRPSHTKESIQTEGPYPTTVLEVPNPNNALLHTSQKPLELFEYLIRTYTNEGDTVLDPTAGSGTTAVACRKSNRHYICIEKEPEYCAIAEKRLAEML